MKYLVSAAVVQRMRLCHFRSRASYRSANVRKSSPVFTKEHFKVTAKWTKGQPVDSPFKEDSRNIYFVGVRSYREKRRGENVNMHAVPFPQFKFCRWKLHMNTELLESLLQHHLPCSKLTLWNYTGLLHVLRWSKRNIQISTGLIHAWRWTQWTLRSNTRLLHALQWSKRTLLTYTSLPCFFFFCYTKCTFRSYTGVIHSNTRLPHALW